MANFKTAIAAENEILKATDVTFGYDSAIDNVAVGMLAVLSGTKNNFVIGGKVTPYANGGLNVSVAPIFSLNAGTESVVAETEVTEPVSFEEADSSLDRIDIVEVRAKETTYDVQTRAMNDPTTGTKSYQEMATKKKITLEVVIKKGSNGSASAPAADNGFVKIAEVIIPAGTTNITAELIKNITARKGGVENADWTADKTATFNPGYLADIFHEFLVSHNEDGTHGNKVIKKSNIDFGTGSVQVNGNDIPSANSVTIHGEDYDSQTSLTALILALVSNTNALYKYSNDILSRYSFIENIPVAASTENVDVTTGGAMTIDGVLVTEGQLVFLKNQTDARENGFWKVQSGAWNRYAGYTSANADAFTHKFVVVTTGTENKGKIYYLDGDSYTIGTSELEFKESNLSYFALPETGVVRDANGNFKAAAPVAEDDVAIKQNVTDEAKERNDYDMKITSHYDSSDGRNLLEVLGVESIADAMAALHKKCEAGDFSGLMLGDYLDLPSLTVNGTTYTWNDDYKNLRIIISGFNYYKGVGDTENSKNHILWTFRNVVLQRQMNTSDTNTGGYGASAMKTFLDGVFTAGLGAAIGADYLYTVRRAISKKGSTEWISCTVFLPTTVEVFGVDTYGDDQNAWNTNSQFPIYASGFFYRIKRYNGSRAWWWLATPYGSDVTLFCYVGGGGNSHGFNASRA